eukprot:SAG31_NODE_12825_length_914_cov_0.755828_2_plen_20_part_01
MVTAVLKYRYLYQYVRLKLL